MNYIFPARADAEIVKALSNQAACQHLIRKFKRQRSWLPWFMILYFITVMFLQFLFIRLSDREDRALMSAGFAPMFFALGFILCTLIGNVVALDGTIKLLLVIQHGHDTANSNAQARCNLE